MPEPCFSVSAGTKRMRSDPKHVCLSCGNCPCSCGASPHGRNRLLFLDLFTLIALLLLLLLWSNSGHIGLNNELGAIKSATISPDSVGRWLDNAFLFSSSSFESWNEVVLIFRPFNLLRQWLCREKVLSDLRWRRLDFEFPSVPAGIISLSACWRRDVE